MISWTISSSEERQATDRSYSSKNRMDLLKVNTLPMTQRAKTGMHSFSTPIAMAIWIFMLQEPARRRTQRHHRMYFMNIRMENLLRLKCRCPKWKHQRHVWSVQTTIMTATGIYLLAGV